MIKKLRPSFLITACLSIAVVTSFVALQNRPVSVGAQSSTLDSRLKSYQKTLNTEFSKSDQKKLTLHCTVAQAKLQELQTRVNTVKTARATAYQNITTQLDKLTTQLDNQAFETTALKSTTSTLKAKLADYTTQMSIYKQALDDSVAVDCKANPAGFNAALQVARTAHDRLIIITPDARSYTLNTLEPLLDQIGAQLDSGQTTGGSQ